MGHVRDRPSDPIGGEGSKYHQAAQQRARQPLVLQLHGGRMSIELLQPAQAAQQAIVLSGLANDPLDLGFGQLDRDSAL